MAKQSEVNLICNIKYMCVGVHRFRWECMLWRRSLILFTSLYMYFKFWAKWQYIVSIASFLSFLGLQIFVEFSFMEIHFWNIELIFSIIKTFSNSGNNKICIWYLSSLFLLWTDKITWHFLQNTMLFSWHLKILTSALFHNKNIKINFQKSKLPFDRWLCWAFINTMKMMNVIF